MQTKKFILLSNQNNHTMRKLLLLIIILLGSFVTYSQETLSEKEKAKRQRNLDAVNPFHKFGYKAKVATLSKGKYLEMFITDSIVQIASFHYNILTNKVTGFTQLDTLNSEATLRPDVVSRWINPDPLSDEFPDKSPYNFVNNNPLRFIDPTGMAPEDIIHVNKAGYILKVEKAEGDHIVMMDGKQLSLNDSKFDQSQLDMMIGGANFRYNADWSGHDKTKLFTSFSNKEMAQTFNDIEIGEINSNFETAKKMSLLGPPLHLAKDTYLAILGHGPFDFTDTMAQVSKKGGNYNQGSGVFPPDGTGGFIKFENNSSLFNVYDAGNFMTGKGFNLLGVSLKKLLSGADINSRATFNGADTKADQNALSEGFNYQGIQWKN